ncbi:hypothetical protein GH714_018210 [Hevea brasiliensis]|uniref:Uncharacterized protein n=1 Tax=Hevea brasiliensis TaxID=3981 RepID=A0A6A6ND11_HEVBR|nr:hypothetical protein GH714_018210 [Hevea brasiliensis]
MDVEIVERRNWDEQVPIENNTVSANSWNSSAKLEFIHFSGEGLEGWLLRVEYFFEMGRIEYEKRVKVVALCLEGRAVKWHQEFVKGNEVNVNWDEYVSALEASFENYVEEDKQIEDTDDDEDIDAKENQKKFETVLEEGQQGIKEFN